MGVVDMKKSTYIFLLIIVVLIIVDIVKGNVIDSVTKVSNSVEAVTEPEFEDLYLTSDNTHICYDKLTCVVYMYTGSSGDKTAYYSTRGNLCVYNNDKNVVEDAASGEVVFKLK
jgi:hypothetical protein